MLSLYLVSSFQKQATGGLNRKMKNNIFIKKKKKQNKSNIYCFINP